MMNDLIFFPVLANLFLALVLYILLGFRKAQAVKSGKIDRKIAAIDNKVWSNDVIKISNNIANQFESPVIFYVLCLVIYSLSEVGTTELVLAWIYVLSRVAHSYVHVNSNHVPTRLRLFMVGQVALLAMMVIACLEMIQ